MDEEWRPVVGWEGFYEVSNFGRVRSLDRTVVRSNGVSVHFKGRIRKYGVLPKGYFVMPLRSGTLVQNKTVHRMVCEAFHGPAPEGEPWALHRNGQAWDNRPENLYWGTPKDNSDDMTRHGTRSNGLEEWGSSLCGRGHDLTVTDAVYTSPKGHRVCRECKRLRGKGLLT